jgi:hypothetical protein
VLPRKDAKKKLAAAEFEIPNSMKFIAVAILFKCLSVSKCMTGFRAIDWMPGEK